MKKTILALFLVLALCLPCFVGCDKSSSNQQGSEKSSENVTESGSSGGDSLEGKTEEESKDFEEIYKNPRDIYAELTSRGYTGTFEEWVASLAGADGKSAYQLAIENGYVGSVEEWLISLVGAPGKDGADGKDAYELAVENGYLGSVEEWLISLVGPSGKDGTDGRGILSIGCVNGSIIITYTDGITEKICNISDLIYTEGLQYYLLPDGKYGVGIGDAKYDSEITIPSTYNGVLVTKIVDEGFKGAWNLKSINIPSSIIEIGDSAFSECTGLTGIVIPEGVEYIGEKAFSNCSRLENIAVPSSLTAIGNYAFENCESLIGVYITDIAKWCSIEVHAYNSNPLYYAKKLYLNDELVTEINIPDGVSEIKSFAFAHCNSLQKVTLPSSVTEIGIHAFNNCKNLESVSLNEGLTDIGYQAFSGSRLKEVTIPESVVSIEESFVSCYLTEIYVNANNLNYCSIDGNLYSKDGKILIQFFNNNESDTVVIPRGVTEIGEYAFAGKEGFSSVIIPDSVKNIGSRAFYMTNLRNVTIGIGVVNIGEAAFSWCILENVNYVGTAEDWNKIVGIDNAFDDDPHTKINFEYNVE